MADEEAFNKKNHEYGIFFSHSHVYKERRKHETCYVQDGDSLCMTTCPILCSMGSQSYFRHPNFQDG